MTDDIVKRLKAGTTTPSLLAEAADEIEKLRAALTQLNAAIDDFWNDKTRPSIAHMNEKTLLKVEAGQRAAKAALGESDD